MAPKKIKKLRVAAKKGDAQAQTELGLAYLNGEGVAKNKPASVRWFRKAADQGFADAQYHLASAYTLGWGISASTRESVRWYRKAAKQGHVYAQMELGGHYSFRESLEESARWYRKAAEQGNADAQCELGDIYRFGVGIDYDPHESVRWYRKAAEQGHEKAQFALGEAYFDGEGIAEDRSKAVRWYRKAAEQGYGHAQHWLGAAYALGLVVARNEREAIRWYRKAAEQEHMMALFYLRMLESKIEDASRRDDPEQWDAEDQFSIGQIYAREAGFGISRQRRFARASRRVVAYAIEAGFDRGRTAAICRVWSHEAVRWLREAAEKGHAEAQEWLGQCYLHGKGVDMDKREAYIWFFIAKASGSEEAAEFLNHGRWSKFLSRYGNRLALKEAEERMEEIDRRKAEKN